MEKSNEEITKIIELITGLAMYFKEELDKSVVELYANALSEFSYPKVKEAIGHFFRTFERMPKISDFYTFFNTGGTDLKTIAEDKWRQIQDIICKCGAYVSWTSPDKAFRRAVEAVGYDNIRNAKEDELKWLKKDFINIYSAFAVKDRHSYEAKDYFMGLIEADNAGMTELPAHGYAGETILCFGGGAVSRIIRADVKSILGEVEKLDYDNLPF